MRKDNWFAQVVAICWQETTFSIFSALLNKNDQFSSIIYYKNYRRVPSESSILKVLSISEELTIILEIYETLSLI